MLRPNTHGRPSDPSSLIGFGFCSSSRTKSRNSSVGIFLRLSLCLTASTPTVLSFTFRAIEFPAFSYCFILIFQGFLLNQTLQIAILFMEALAGRKRPDIAFFFFK
jgi:hypothetical protein